MWPRTAEIALGCWLAMSPFIFRYPAVPAWYWWNDFVCATLVITLSLLSFISEARRAHLLILIVAVWLMGVGWASSGFPAPPPQQNWIITGLFLLMIDILPTDCVKPPVAWQKWNKEHGGTAVEG